MTNPIVAKVEEIARRVAESLGLELVEVEVKGGGSARVVRIFIDKPDGVTHADCEEVSLQAGTILDVEEVIPGGQYTLEVSSPGVERKLKKIQDFERFQGKKAKVFLAEPIDNSKRWEGVIAAVEGDRIRLEAQGGQVVEFSLNQVDRANLTFEWGS